MKILLIALSSAITMLTAMTALAQSPAPDWSQAEEIDIVLSSYKFTPDELLFQANVPYRLHFSNDSSKNHNFAAPELFEEAIVAEGDAGKIKKGKIEVGKGESVEILFIPTEPGIYPIHCSHPFHASNGMKGAVTVE